MQQGQYWSVSQQSCNIVLVVVSDYYHLIAHAVADILVNNWPCEPRYYP